MLLLSGCIPCSDTIYTKISGRISIISQTVTKSLQDVVNKEQKGAGDL